MGWPAWSSNAPSARASGDSGLTFRHTWNRTRGNTSATPAIRAIDYTVIFVRDMAAMRRFYEGVLRFPLLREQWRDRNLMGIASAPPILRT